MIFRKLCEFPEFSYYCTEESIVFVGHQLLCVLMQMTRRIRRCFVVFPGLGPYRQFLPFVSRIGQVVSWYYGYIPKKQLDTLTSDFGSDETEHTRGHEIALIHQNSKWIRWLKLCRMCDKIYLTLLLFCRKAPAWQCSTCAVGCIGFAVVR